MLWPRIKAPANDEAKQMILDYCKEYLDVFEKPKEIIFKDELPKTLVGKVAYHTLEQEAEKEQSEQKETATVWIN